MRNMFFCYEKNFAGHWGPVIYYDEVPELRRENKHSRSQVVDVTGHPEEVPISLLQKTYPLEVQDDTLFDANTCVIIEYSSDGT